MGRAVRTAVFFAGHWYQSPSLRTQTLHLILPHHAFVLVATSIVTWCSPAREQALRELHADAIRMMAGWHTTANMSTRMRGYVDRLTRHLQRDVAQTFTKAVRSTALLLPEPVIDRRLLAQRMRLVSHNVQPRTGGPVSPFKVGQMECYIRQFAKVSAAIRALLRMPEVFDVVIRTRVDVAILAPILELPVAVRRHGIADVYSVWATFSASSPFASVPFMHDWIYVSTPTGMSELAKLPGVNLMYNATARCYGFCPEEQVALQLMHLPVRMQHLAWNVTLNPRERAASRAMCTPLL